MEIIEKEDFIHDEKFLIQYQHKLIDFVTEEIVIEGVLECA